MKLLVSQIVANPYRDIENYPINRKKVDSLKESIQQTTFWDNLLARPQGNSIDPALMGGQTMVAFLEGLDQAFNENGPLFFVELAYGHHRIEAVKELGIEVIDIPVKSIDNRTMLKIMANENKDDWASNMSVILETVRQARKFLADSVAPYKTYEDYAKDGGSFFSKEQFVQLDAQGIGFKAVQKFLGETWSEADVRKAVSVLKDLDVGLYTKDMVTAFPSVSVLGSYSKLVAAINKQNWPVFFKEKMVEDIATMICDPKTSATVKTLTSATGAVNNGKDPVNVVRSPGQKQKDFNVVKAIKDLVYENMDPKTKLVLSEIPELEGFKDYPELPEILQKVQESINRSEAAKAAAATGQPQTTPAGETITPDTDLDALEATVAAAESEAAQPAAVDGTLPPVEGEDAIVNDSGVVFERFVQSSEVMIAQTDAFAAALNNGADLDEGHPAHAALEALANSVLAAFMAAYGVDDAMSLVTAAGAAYTAENADQDAAE